MNRKGINYNGEISGRRRNMRGYIVTYSGLLFILFLYLLCLIFLYIYINQFPHIPSCSF